MQYICWSAQNTDNMQGTYEGGLKISRPNNEKMSV